MDYFGGWDLSEYDFNSQLDHIFGSGGPEGPEGDGAGPSDEDHAIDDYVPLDDENISQDNKSNDAINE